MKLIQKIQKIFSLIITVGLISLNSFAVLAQDTSEVPAILDPVENLVVKSVGNESVTLTWDPLEVASAYVINYGTESNSIGGVYNRASIPVNNVTEYKIDNLENDQEYFFAVIGQNEDGEVSRAYSNEVSATPSPSGESSDTATPYLLGVEAIDDTTINMVFSEPMTWPENPIENITVVKRYDSSELALELVNVIDNQTLSVKTAAQAPGSEYSLTINEFFLDDDNNPVDDDKRTKIFLGAITNDEIDNANTATEFKIDNIIVVDATALEVIFSRNIVLSDNPITQFAIVRTDTPEDILQIQEISLSELAGNRLLIKTEPQINVSYSMLITDLKDTEGNSMPEANNTVSFVGYRNTVEADETPPADVSNLHVEKLNEDGSSVKLTWIHSANTDGDLSQYKVYTQEDGGNFNLAQAIPADQNEFTLEGLPTEGSFKFKVTALDDYSNESQGIVVNLENELVISETGPANVVFLVLAALATSFWFRKRSLA